MSPDKLFLLLSLLHAIDMVQRAFGAPGDHGYGTPEGDALFELYKQRSEIAFTLANNGYSLGQSSPSASKPEGQKGGAE